MKFVTLFPNATNIHLIKDVGQIPYTLKAKFGIDAVLVTGNKIRAEDGYLESVFGLKIEKLPFSCFHWKIGCFIYLLFKSKEIDWLNLYHFGKKSLYLASLYKFRNRNGHVYLKLDMNYKTCDQLSDNKQKRNIFTKCLEIMDVVSIESEEVRQRIQEYTDKKLLLIPNGYITDEGTSKAKEKKENAFLTVGRLGTKEKATEILLEAFAISATRQNWVLKLVGPICDDFRMYIEDYFRKYPELKKRVFFLGTIKDKKVLNKEYEKAKIFILPSRYEGFPLVLPEAQAKGCKMILTSVIPPCKAFVPEEKFGRIIEPDNSVALAEAMIAMANIDISDSDVYEISSYAWQNFSWQNICDKLWEHLVEMRQKENGGIK